MFSKVLIASRGEIAVRIIRACKEMGIATVAVFSEADRDSLWVNLADESICIGPAPVQQSYLNMTAVLSAAINTGAQAIHPGYGLLSENAKFASLCEQCGLVFIGPSSALISKMGDKDEARKTMAALGVPIIPGSGVLKDPKEAEIAAEKIGYPLLIKAKAGGGGRGIRKVTESSSLSHEFEAAVREAEAYFGDGAVYLEKYLTPVNHVEMQVLCDQFGQALCLGDRECSIQRKNQKMLEESPSLTLTESMRQEMTALCTQSMKALNYTGLGTLEFLCTQDGQYYFMEMNTRLQVEHPVTEMVTGIDLVKWQLRVAAGLPLNFKQEDIKLTGCAIECRLNAENPALGFRPSSGKISLLHIPGGPWVRFDTAVFQDYIVPPYYDSLIAKLIVHAATREEAIRKMNAALCEMVIEGVDHTADLQLEILSDDDFLIGNYHTNFMESWDR
ncbi:MAG: acetyl-CoA carboxylase biotin carboxylase subunit [Clostridiales bacterium]|nr:acetyl-CoA carboxylase biotin carboxylase subunit [Clostridiales bacterium]